MAFLMASEIWRRGSIHILLMALLAASRLACGFGVSYSPRPFPRRGFSWRAGLNVRWAFALIVLSCGITGCASPQLGSFLRSPADSKASQSVTSDAAQLQSTQSPETFSTPENNPPEAQPSADNAVSQALNRLELDGKLSRQERIEFETSLAQIENPVMRSQIISMVTVAGSTTLPGQGSQYAQSGPAGPQHHNHGTPPAAPSGFGVANSVISDDENQGGSRRHAIDHRRAQNTDAPQPNPFSYAQELAQRLQPSQDLHTEGRRDELEGPYDPRSDRISQATYTNTSTDSDRTAGHDNREYAHGYAWQQSLDETIALLERQTVDVPRSDAEVKEHAFLRMLYLMAEREEDALRPIQGIPAISQDFWIEEIYGLAEYLDHEAFPTASKRAAAAMERFAKAHRRLAELANLRIKQAMFCREVKSYGVTTPFAKDVFQPQETVLLYAEIENFRSTPGPEGYRTKLRGSYIIQNEAKQRVAEEVLAPIEDICQNERRDFFLNYFVKLPPQIYPGRYKLILTIEDTQAQRFGTTTVEFEIGRPAAN
ncbi:MAG: hypothetical protein MPJ50_04215 [Pirellulales bacterium]|nr:hypothetical protein [Pirellulales bacterium]